MKPLSRGEEYDGVLRFRMNEIHHGQQNIRDGELNVWGQIIDQ